MNSASAKNLSFQQRYIVASLGDYSPKENLVIGPNSAELQLALLAGGTAGESFREIAHALGVQASTADAFDKSAYLTELLQKRTRLNAAGNKSGTLVRSSSCFLATSRIQPLFVEHAHRFGAEALYAADAADMTNMANQWAAEATATHSTPQGLINPLLSRPLDRLCACIALSADAFELAFKSPFDPEETRERLFTGGDGAKHISDLMYKKFQDSDGAAYFEKRNGTRGVVLAYGQAGEFSLRLTEVPTHIAPDTQLMAGWFATQTASPIVKHSKRVRLSVPRADISGERDTAATRARLGIKAIYGKHADLTNLLEGAEIGDPCIGKSVEKAVLKMNEVRTEGAVVQYDAVSRGASVDTSPILVLDATYMVEVVKGRGLASNAHEDVLMLAVVNNPGRLPAPKP